MLIPLFLWLALGPENIAAAWVVGFVLGSTDWIDGRLARHYNQVSKLGTAIDPFFDRLAVAAAATVIIMLDLAPIWTVVVVLARDGLLLAMIPFLSAKGVPRPAVTWSGKAGSFGVMWAFGVLAGRGDRGSAAGVGSGPRMALFHPGDPVLLLRSVRIRAYGARFAYAPEQTPTTAG